MMCQRNEEPAKNDEETELESSCSGDNDDESGSESDASDESSQFVKGTLFHKVLNPPDAGIVTIFLVLDCLW